jgi:hypothetical protein
MNPDHIETLRQRAEYLAGRIEAKKQVGWEFEYDMRERAALLWAIRQLNELQP